MVFKTTNDIKIPKTLISQVIGQDEAVEVIKKAAAQRRHVLLIGEPGTGKSMLGLGLAELLPKEKLKDLVSFYNPNDAHKPLVREMPAGKGRELVEKSRMGGSSFFKGPNLFIFIVAIFSMIAPWWIREQYGSDIMFAAFFLGGMMFLAAFVFLMQMGQRLGGGKKKSLPKIIVDNYNVKKAPFYDATGAHAGALLGDVLHDPFQSGGLGTPAHERVVAGMIHKAHLGVLFIDEIAALRSNSQQELLTALQEKKFSITGQSERSAGAMVRTEAAPCNFVLVAAGNVETIKNLHPALRSRIRGYGYEIYMNETMEDNPKNRSKIAIFVAQEVAKDKKIPAFAREAVDEIVEQARRMANRKDHLTLRLRELGGLVRAAGDLAKEEFNTKTTHKKEGSNISKTINKKNKKKQLVKKIHVIKARKIARTLEQQISDKYIERKKEYEVILTKGKKIGRVNGLAVIGGGSAMSGILLPIEAEVTPGGKKGEIIATGKLGVIAKEAVKNVSAIIKKYFGEDIKEKYDIYVQFLQTYEGVEGDSASIAIAVSIISALKKIPIKQEYAITGSLSIRGEVLPVGGVSSKVDAAIESGIKKVIVPKSNLKDIIISSDKKGKIKIIPANSLGQVLKEVLDWKGNEHILKKIMK